ncbi:MAG: iron-sulfur cluster-binding protein, partial [Candidatus Choladocola sp.]|nr:iron-sulfur cluster-binding protein [Candidatus Choladocola sp.]
LIPALDRLRAEGLFEQLDTKICIGQGYRGKTGRLGVGQCTSAFDFCIRGCPPVEEQIYEGLKRYLEGIKEKDSVIQ